MAGAVFGDLGVSIFVAAIAFGDVGAPRLAKSSTL